MALKFVSPAPEDKTLAFFDRRSSIVSRPPL